MKDFSKLLPRQFLDIADKTRANIFAWRGQFSPQLVQYLLEAYCPTDAVVLDPFVGSGTVLYEAARMSLAAYGFEINPAAWAFSKTCECANADGNERKQSIGELRRRIDAEFPIAIFASEQLSNHEIEQKVIAIGDTISDRGKTLLNALVILLDLANNKITNDLVQSKFFALAKLVESLPYSEKLVKADLHDARALPLPHGSTDFVITSPPYINVFNYHQNYRRSAEVLGWDLLSVARSEIGSNRANRGNRFVTVVQYCVDMSRVLRELSRVLKHEGRAVLIVGRESRVLGVPFYNADIIERIAAQSGLFEVVLHQNRVFTNRFGESIQEDILNLARAPSDPDPQTTLAVARSVASIALEGGLPVVSAKNRPLLLEALRKVDCIEGTPLFDSLRYEHYQARELVLMVKEGRKEA